MAKQVSKEQKFEKLMSLFTPSEVFSLKELEKLGGKVGLRSNLIKDLITELVNDNKISCDKIGISLYYWRFPVTKDVELAKLEMENEKNKQELNNLQTKERSLNETRQSEKRDENIREFKDLTEKKSKYTLTFNYNDYKSLKTQSDEIKQAINEITDDIFILQGHVTSQFGMARSEFNSAFGIKDDMDTIE
ncbi:mnd1, Protein involved in meiotic recombination/predicted coiled-coil protein [Pseudoloma neurophilia]|uniref:Mnd1, Protein involved in meiotic recombination/predicted coiled-coil protein n=1 Tax=Pseudoloma neurophilia TaxID=146866 RepID=A0A0R0LVX7_9MICR|nr:mnd1, Protein involved in meiotic recombination/predicted coiled-coil protein [Pseudoloma neurophilia]